MHLICSGSYFQCWIQVSALIKNSYLQIIKTDTNTVGKKTISGGKTETWMWTCAERIKQIQKATSCLVKVTVLASIWTEIMMPNGERMKSTKILVVIFFRFSNTKWVSNTSITKLFTGKWKIFGNRNTTTEGWNESSQRRQSLCVLSLLWRNDSLSLFHVEICACKE